MQRVSQSSTEPTTGNKVEPIKSREHHEMKQQSLIPITPEAAAERHIKLAFGFTSLPFSPGFCAVCAQVEPESGKDKPVCQREMGVRKFSDHPVQTGFQKAVEDLTASCNHKPGES